jgi:RHS repeat-associated protein
VVDSDTIKYFLDGSTRLAAGGANVIADYDGDNVLQATYVTPGLDNNTSQTRSGSTYYYLKDGLGSIRNLVDSNESTQNTYDYYAFGKELGSWTENVTNRYTYTAREYDGESEQYYYRARYYRGAGVFSSRDMDETAVTELYLYVLNNPLTLADPTGVKARITVAPCNISVVLQICIYVDNSNTGWTALDPNVVATTIEREIEGRWNGHRVGCCDVKFRAYVSDFATYESIPADCDNKITVLNYYTGKSNVNRKGNKGTWMGVPGYRGYHYAHEAGHLMRLHDEYGKKWPWSDYEEWPSHAGHLMAMSYNARADYHEVFDILDQHGVFQWGLRKIPKYDYLNDWDPPVKSSEYERYVKGPYPCGCDVKVPAIRNWEH